MPWAGETIVVDTGSTDGTIALAERAGARVLHFAWCDDFAAARNHALAAATREWVLVLDADEVLRVDDAAAWARALAAARHARAPYSPRASGLLNRLPRSHRRRRRRRRAGAAAVSPRGPRHGLPRRDPRTDRRRRRATLRDRARALHPLRARRPHRRGRRRAPHGRAQPAPGAIDGRVAPRRSIQLVLPGPGDPGRRSDRAAR